ncbi:hypothetical protein Sjap_012125 [Stephania japonica]|uniref:Uncharacterized protein n=1 Tax=Stephania japonica TaxID=461633 RepID=A0AAP0IX45_9MAGN
MEAMYEVTTTYNGTQYYPPFPYLNQVIVFHSQIHTHTSFPPNFNYIQPDPPPFSTSSSYNLQHNTSKQNINIPQQQRRHLSHHQTDLGIFDAERYFKETVQDHNKGREMQKAPTMNRSSSASQHCSSSNVYTSELTSMDGNGDYTNCGNSNVCRTRLSTSSSTSRPATWNSQAMLLSNPPRSKSIAASGKRKWWCFGFMKCPCISRKSVIQVSEPKISFSQPRIIPHEEGSKEVVHVQAPQQRCNSLEHHNSPDVKKSDPGKLSPRYHSANIIPSFQIDEKAQKKEVVHHDSDRNNLPKSKSYEEEEAFTFPVLNSFRENENGDKQEPKSRNRSVSARPQQRRLREQQVKSREQAPEEESQPTEVLHHYCSPERTPYWPTLAVTKDYNSNFQSYAFPASPATRVATTEDDLASDASSDLFEIDSLSTHPHSQLYPMHYDSMNTVAEDTWGYETRRFSFSHRGVDEVSDACSFTAADW